MNYTKREVKAAKKSLKHWIEIKAEIKERRYRARFGLGASACALCIEFDDCLRCPLLRVSDGRQCGNAGSKYTHVTSCTCVCGHAYAPKNCQLEALMIAVDDLTSALREAVKYAKKPRKPKKAAKITGW